MKRLKSTSLWRKKRKRRTARKKPTYFIKKKNHAGQRTGKKKTEEMLSLQNEYDNMKRMKEQDTASE